MDDAAQARRILARAALGHPAHSVDVVIVGYGCAGASAAIAAAGRGEVLIAEAAAIGGGSSAASHAIIYLGGGTPIQQACGFEDSPEDMIRYLMAACGPDPDPALIEPYCEDSVEHFHWLCRQGIPFKPSYFDGGHFPDTDDGLVYSGNERVHPFDRLARPAPRGHIPTAQGAAGALLMQRLSRAVERSGAEIRTGARCVSLVQERDGRIVGVVLSADGQEHFVAARRGVILTTGGFIYNDAMLAERAPDLLRCRFKVGTPSDDGSGILLGLAAGAEGIGLDRGDVLLPLYPPIGLKRGVLIDRHGRRFINEDAYHGRIGELALERCGGEVRMIIDSEIDERPVVTPAPLVAVAETIEELEAALAIPRGQLQQTLSEYNAGAARGQDPLFHKAAPFVQPIVNPPFGALDLSMEAATYGGFTLGGLRIDAWGRALASSGEPIPGLFAAGRASSGVAKRGYSSGLSLGDSTFFGRRAGLTASQ